MGTVYMSNKVCSPDKVEMVTLTWSRRQMMMVFLQLSPPIWRACAPYLRNSVSSIWSFFKHSNCQFWYHHPQKYAYIHICIWFIYTYNYTYIYIHRSRYDMDMDIIIYVYIYIYTEIQTHTSPFATPIQQLPCHLPCRAEFGVAQRRSEPRSCRESQDVERGPTDAMFGAGWATGLKLSGVGVSQKKQGWKWRWNTGWWFGSLLLWLSIYWEFHHPNWRSHIFQRGG